MLVATAFCGSFLLRFDDGIPLRYKDLLTSVLSLAISGKTVAFAAFGLYI